MHPYHLNISIPKSNNSIQPADVMVFAGSCFSENIASKLQNLYFDCIHSPNGIVFNPISLAVPFQKIINNTFYAETDTIQHSNMWYSLHHHGKINHINQSDLLNQINQKQEDFKSQILKANWLFITFGSAWVYTLKANNIIVANCHKIPQTQFEKRLLTVAEITTIWKPILAHLKLLNPTLNIVFTVSPVKHLRDGVLENNLSKATLLLAINELVKINATYFPAYELLNDDLRDYRFYETDAAHPNAIAIDYIFDKFKTTYFNEKNLQIITEIEKLNTMLGHKTISNNTNEIQAFEQAKNTQIEKVIGLVPHFKDLIKI